jgi:putative FmdB family regulatory protein
VPVYEFVCEDCGPFEQRHSFTEAGAPIACPSCGRKARRVYSVPSIKRMPAALSGAMGHAEKSAHEPQVVRRPTGAQSLGRGTSTATGGPGRSATNVIS